MIDGANRRRINIFLDLVNGLIALVISFFAPVTAFVLLFFKIPLIVAAFLFLASVRRKMSAEEIAGLKRFE